MSNIFHEIKRGFLILGFTGPLNSGCTYAAHFFEKEINEYIKRAFKKVLPWAETNVKIKYQLLQEKKISWINNIIIQ